MNLPKRSYAVLCGQLFRSVNATSHRRAAVLALQDFAERQGDSIMSNSLKDVVAVVAEGESEVVGIPTADALFAAYFVIYHPQRGVRTLKNSNPFKEKEPVWLIRRNPYLNVARTVDSGCQEASTIQAS